MGVGGGGGEEGHFIVIEVAHGHVLKCGPSNAYYYTVVIFRNPTPELYVCLIHSDGYFSRTNLVRAE